MMPTVLRVRRQLLTIQHAAPATIATRTRTKPIAATASSGLDVMRAAAPVIAVPKPLTDRTFLTIVPFAQRIGVARPAESTHGRTAVGRTSPGPAGTFWRPRVRTVPIRTRLGSGHGVAGV